MIRSVALPSPWGGFPSQPDPEVLGDIRRVRIGEAITTIACSTAVPPASTATLRANELWGSRALKRARNTLMPGHPPEPWRCIPVLFLNNLRANWQQQHFPGRLCGFRQAVIV